MKHQYKQDASDYRAAAAFAATRALRRSGWRYVSSGFRLFIMLGTAFSLISFIDFYRNACCQDLGSLNLGLSTLVLMCGVFLFMPYVFSSVVSSRSFGPSGIYSDLHTVEITTTHLVVSVRSNVYSYAFADMIGIERDAVNIYAVLDQGAALYVPLRSFQTSAESEDFMQALQGALAANNSLQARRP